MTRVSGRFSRRFPRPFRAPLGAPHHRRLLALLLLPTASALAQDSLSLGALHAAALAHDPRSGVPSLLRDASALRERDLASANRLQSALNGQATYQSDVTRFPGSFPGGAIPDPPFARFNVTLDLQQSLYDAGAVQARRAVERARLAEATSDVGTQLYRLKQEVNGALFTALLMQERLAELEAARTDVDQRLAEARVRVREGSALSRDTSAIVAERYRLDESRAQVEASRRAAVSALAALTGRALRPDIRLDLDEVAAALGDARTLPEAPDAPRAVERARPEFAAFDATRARLDEEASALAVDTRPQVSAFVQGGVGRPGLNQLVRDTNPFYIAGVRASWRPFERDKVRRREEQVRLQQRITDLQERAFAEGLDRATTADREEIARLIAARERDELLVQARADVERAARVQFEEGAATAAAWISARSDLLEARLQLRRHLVELAYARARLLTTLGLSVR